MRNLILSAVLASASLFGMTAAHAEDIQVGKQYVELSSPVPVSKPGKIEVVELFWYGCPHCYQFEPTVNAWSEKLPEDVNFVRVPAMFGGLWNVHGQLSSPREHGCGAQRAQSRVRRHPQGRQQARHQGSHG